MTVVDTKCSQGHAMVSKPLRAVRPCKGCGEPCSTVYDCTHGCYGKCCTCWVKEYRDRVVAMLGTAGEVQ